MASNTMPDDNKPKELPEPPITEEEAHKAAEECEIEPGVRVTRAQAYAKFGKYAKMKGIGNISLGIGINNMGVAKHIAKVGVEILNDKNAPLKERTAAGQLAVSALRAANEITQTVSNLAKEELKAKAEPPQMHAPPMMVQAEGDLHIHEAHKRE